MGVFLSLVRSKQPCVRRARRACVRVLLACECTIQSACVRKPRVYLRVACVPFVCVCVCAFAK
eukprot:1284278-Lingulodinium_polyedra.AAC.1